MECFKDELNRYVKVEGCSLLDPGVDLSDYKDYIALPIRLERKKHLSV